MGVWSFLGVSGLSERDCRSPRPKFCSRLCVHGVCQCVFICHACVCVCIYLARVCCLCFPFCSVSENVGETSVFNQGPGNCLVVAMVATVLSGW